MGLVFNIANMPLKTAYIPLEIINTINLIKTHNSVFIYNMFCFILTHDNLYDLEKGYYKDEFNDSNCIYFNIFKSNTIGMIMNKVYSPKSLCVPLKWNSSLYFSFMFLVYHLLRRFINVPRLYTLYY